MKSFNIFLRKLVLCVVILFFLPGCIGNFWGSYVGQPREGQQGRYSRSFNCPYNVCFGETLEILKEIGATIFSKSQKKGIISAMHFGRVYRNYVDTTEVKIFFKKIDSEKTKIDVACGNYGLAEAVSQKIFSELNKKYQKEVKNINKE